MKQKRLERASDKQIPVFRGDRIDMLIDFNEIKEMTIPGMNEGTGTMTS